MEFMRGAMLSTVVVASSYVVIALLLKFVRRCSSPLAGIFETSLAWTCLAARNLHEEASSVAAALDSGDLPGARAWVARIVGRDTAALDSSEVSRAAVETIAESLCDGVIAPMFYLAAGGVPLAMAYKAVNTLDSMIGHADQRYQHFGKFAARLDDVANFIPARLTALLIITSAAALPACSANSAVQTWAQDHARHKSPNAGHPESAMAGALAVRLGGANSYAGEVVHSPQLGERFAPPLPLHVHRALRAASLTTALAVAALSWWCSRSTERRSA